MTGLNSQNNENSQNSVNFSSNSQENSQNSATPSLRASEASVAIHNGKGDFKAVDCHENPNGFSRNDELNSQNTTQSNPQKSAPKLALVVPCYNEEAVIAQSYKVLNAKIQALISQHKIAQDSFICFVDDGSKDKTCEILLALKSGLKSPLGDSFAQSFHPASLRRMSNTPHSQGETIAQSNTANSIILEKNSQNTTQNSQANKSPSLASVDFNQKSPSLAEGDLGGGLLKNSQNGKNSRNSLNLNLNSQENSSILQDKSVENSNNATNTHPQTPSAREGALNEANSTFARKGALPLANATSQSKGDFKAVDCHENPSGFSRNDELDENSQINSQTHATPKTADTTPQTHATQTTAQNSQTNSQNGENSQTATQNTPQNSATQTTQATQTQAPHKVLKLSRNYGQQNALLAGLDFVKDKCDCVVSIDGDLQQDINAVDEMLANFQSGADIVYGVRKAYTHESILKKYTSFAFYKFMQLLGVNILNNHIEYRLMSARAVCKLLEFSEVNLFLRGIVPLLGYKSAVVHYEQFARFAGDTKYSFVKLFSLAWDAITSFSVVPLRLMSILGVVLFGFAVIYGFYALYMRLFTDTPISGWTSTVLLLLFFGGVQFLGLGIMGEYIGKIYAEVKRRPRYIVESVL